MTSRPSPTERRRSRRRVGRGRISILSDVMMPKLDGQQLTRAVRADRFLARGAGGVAVGARGEEARIEALKEGADDYVVKPFSARELLARIDLRLQIARFRSEALAATRESEVALRASDRRKDEFIAMLSHELRNPSPLCATVSRSCACNTSGRSTPAGPTT